MMLKKQGHGQISVILAANSIGYMKNKISLVNERSI